MSPTSSRNSVPPLAASTRPGLRAVAPVKAPRSWPKTSLSNRVSGRPRAVHHHERPLGAPAGLVHRAREQLLAGTRLALQQHARVRGRHPRDQLEHALEGGRAADQAAVIRHPTGDVHRLHLLDEPGDLAAGVAHRGRARCSRIPRRAACGADAARARAGRTAGCARAGRIRRRDRRDAVAVGHVVAGSADHVAACAAGHERR